MLRNYTLRCAVTAITIFSVGLSPLTVHANPAGGQVVGGSASIQGQGTANVTVNQSTDKTIINWQSFNIGASETTRFNQPSASSIALNRVTGDKNPSQIMGTLTANGRVFLVNPEGFIFGPNSKINTAGFLATTNDIANEDFMAGKYDFKIPGNPNASIINKGSITVSDMGMAALVAPSVRNEGIIAANMGKVALSASNGFSLDFYGDNLINFALNDEVAGQILDVETGEPVKNIVENKGMLSANGGTVVMSASTARAVVDSVINNSGVIEAQSVGLKDGKIILSAQTTDTKTANAPEQKIVVSGTLDASGKNAGEKGGKIQITGENIALKNAKLDASGDAEGGKVLVGGDYHGGKPLPDMLAQYNIQMENEVVPNATKVTVDGDSFITASALTNGNGGKVVFWSDGTMDFAGAIRANGGNLSGNGGFVETSGKQSLKYGGSSVFAYAAKGKNGVWLCDPDDDIIGDSEAEAIMNSLNNGTDSIHMSTGYIHLMSDIIKSSGGDAALILSGNDLAQWDDVRVLSGSGKLSVTYEATNGDIVMGSSPIWNKPKAIISSNGGDVSLIALYTISIMNGIIDASYGKIRFKATACRFAGLCGYLNIYSTSRFYANKIIYNVIGGGLYSQDQAVLGIEKRTQLVTDIKEMVNRAVEDFVGNMISTVAGHLAKASAAEKKFYEALLTDLRKVKSSENLKGALKVAREKLIGNDKAVTEARKALKQVDGLLVNAEKFTVVMDVFGALEIGEKFDMLLHPSSGGDFMSASNEIAKSVVGLVASKGTDFAVTLLSASTGPLGLVLKPVLGWLAGYASGKAADYAYDNFMARTVVSYSATNFYSNIVGGVPNVLGFM